MNSVTPSQTSGRPRDQQASRAILEATIEMLKERGYSDMSIEAVAAAAGVGKATIYRRYASKAELVIAALDEVVVAPPVPDTGTIRGDLEIVLEHFRQALIIDLGTTTVGSIIAEAQRQPELIAALRTQFTEPRRDVIRTLLARATQRGELRGGLDIETIIDLLIGGLFIHNIHTGDTPKTIIPRILNTIEPAIPANPS